MSAVERYCVSLAHYEFLSSEPHSKGAKRRLENSTQSSQTPARRQREAAAKRQSHMKTTERTAYHPKCRAPALPEEHTLAHSHKKNICAPTHTLTHSLTHTHTHTHTHTQIHTHTYISALFAKAETLELSTNFKQSSEQLHSKMACILEILFKGSNGTGNLFHDCSFVVYLSEFYSEWGHCFLNVWSF